MSQSSTDRPFDQSSTATLSRSDVHRLLSSERRQILLGVLEGRQTTLDLDELARLVTEHEDGVDGTDPTDVDRVAITLHHNHLPKLAELDLVRYDHRAERIRTTDIGGRAAAEVDEFDST